MQHGFDPVGCEGLAGFLRQIGNGRHTIGGLGDHGETALADLARDLPGELGERGFTVVTQTTYRMAAVADLPEETRKAFATDAVEAVLHYSRRSARAFIEAIRADGVEVSALSLPQYCLSAGIATVLRDAGAVRVVVAASPDEGALFAALARQRA